MKAPHYIYHMNLTINYLLVGIVIQFFMHYGAIKIAPQHTFIHKERIILILIWPVSVIWFIISFVKVFFSKNG